MNQFEVLLKHVKGLEDDFAKFYDKGNKTAGTRIRKGMQDLKEMAQSIRLDVQNRKNEAGSSLMASWGWPLKLYRKGLPYPLHDVTSIAL
eukprot:gene709-880_t